MKIGIITFHRANNFGTVLQCYALQETLRHLGYEAEVVDYREPFTELIYNPIRWDIMKQGLTRPRLMVGYLLKVLPERYKRAKKYNAFREKYLNCSRKIKKGENMPQDIDVFLIGSDQMWSLHPTGNKIEPVYFGEFKIPATSSIQGYAISSNIQSLHTIGKERLSKYIRNFKRLSFREKTICDEVEKLTGRRGKVVLDPSLLLDYNDWNKLTTHNIVNKKYILTYFLHEESSDPEFKKKVQLFAQRKGLELVDMFDIAFSPVNFLNAIKHAECILATSFHAVAFSILFQKTFYALKTNDGKDIRYINLMGALGINRLTDSNALSTLCPTAIDYEMVNNKLKELRIDSLEYLKNIITPCQK